MCFNVVMVVPKSYSWNEDRQFGDFVYSSCTDFRCASFSFLSHSDNFGAQYGAWRLGSRPRFAWQNPDIFNKS